MVQIATPPCKKVLLPPFPFTLALAPTRTVDASTTPAVVPASKAKLPPLPSPSRTLLFWQVRTRRRDEVLTLLDMLLVVVPSTPPPEYAPYVPRPRSHFPRPDVGAPCHAPLPTR